MGDDDILTDDYVADLLVKDANDCSLKYSALGMDAYTPANMPKPNTRFLRHIIKGTDTHNKNLLAKEAAESKARLQDLEHSEEVKRLKVNPNTRDIRKRQMGDIHAILGGGSRRRRPDGESSTSKQDEAGHSGRHHARRRDPEKEKDDLFESRQSSRARDNGRLASRDSDRRSSHKSSRSRRERDNDSQTEDDTERRRRNRRRRDRSRSPIFRRKSHSPERRRRHRQRSRSPARRDDSDPLEDLIGPMPAPKPRGRGALAGSSGIDQRFSETYDPKLDVAMEDDGGEGQWDDVVEAFRDRQKLRQNQEQRLRDAGFADANINKTWQHAGTQEEGEEDVRWSKAGEKREWDMGKEDDESD
ncbi:uncharacterized protein J7T54_001348 [Emericellopsis cladophorae]|uniref:Pre-mRNA-splicing factor 38B n=1 Tax=Emericellopsis cladophorae TaxID=2686198 RepID=A0A9P9Y347_9HYPO|nr:uncharacterized protein J7T54_001348 [Emericellopsis cladophorae]KAI6782491.1 hypothetical protein J7T54_001348 [Emericellopsis cladophorae]